MKVRTLYNNTHGCYNCYPACYTVVMIGFISSTFSGLESNTVMLVQIVIQGGIIASRDIDVFITFSPITAIG